MDHEMDVFCSDLLQSVRQMKAGAMTRKTEYIPQNDNTIRRLITLSDGTVERDEILSGIACTRMKSKLSQSQFAKLLGISVRTLQEWEQGRKQPSGAAKTLLKVAEKHPEFLHELAI
jgi:putative transcriptional regulator